MKKDENGNVIAKKRMSKKTFTIILSIVAVFLIALTITANVMLERYRIIVTTYFDQTTSERVDNGPADVDANYYPSSYDNVEDLNADGEALGIEIADEGIVLLKNDEQFLPVKADQKVSLFGLGSTNFLYSGGGSGGSVSSDVTLKDAFESEGFTVNPTLWDFFDSTKHKRTYAGLGAGSFKVDEIPQDEYTDEVKASFSDYNDLAVVVLNRIGSEGTDLVLDLEENQGSSDGTGYLSITPNERALIQMIQDDSTFKDIVVILNATNAMELGWMKDYPKIKACMYVEGTGATGIYSIPRIIDGTVNPSGKLVDTFAYDSKSAPSAMNFGDMAFTNSDVITSGEAGVPYAEKYGVDLGNKYTLYQEGIYIGYRYYETRYEDKVLGTSHVGDYDYGQTVQYPFGFGLSYTDFEQQLTSSTENEDGSYDFTVEVTNTGDVAGKDIVELYFQSPYTDFDKENAVEKSALELVGFDKTDILNLGESQTLTIHVDQSEMKSYASQYKEGSYIIDAGTYYFAIGNDVHDALNNILAQKGFTEDNGMTAAGNADKVAAFDREFDDTTYATSEYTGVEIHNLFADADINYYGQDVPYLTRSDWEGTYPTHVQLEATPQMLEDMKPKDGVEDGSGLEMPVMNAKNGTTIVQAMGKDYDDPIWDDILDNLSFEDMNNSIQLGGYSVHAIERIAFDRLSDKDGPAGLNTNYSGGSIHAMAYPSETMIAQTWNIDLVSRMGALVAEDALNSERSNNGSAVIGWYAPAVNIHRSPYSGRNFEYFSEDPFISGQFVATETKAATAKGIVVYVKHFAVNDQETNRIMLNTFANEQSIREIYTYGFEKSVTEGNANGIMTSLNRIGCVYASADEGLINGLLRNEWGFGKIVKTDFADNYTNDHSYYNAIASLKAGTDSFLNTDNTYCGVDDAYRDNPYVVNMMRQAVHRSLYTFANSAAMNGLTTTTVVKPVLALWEKIMIALDVLVVIVVLLIAYLIRRKWRHDNIKIISK